jgi:short-subunit dehydrogenase
MVSTEVVLVTGASSGIGLETTRKLLERNHVVIATAPSESELALVPEEAPYKLVVDLCNQATIDQVPDFLKQENLSLSCLLNNAGYAQPGPVELVDDERLRKQFDVNFFGTLALTRTLLPVLRESARATGHRSRIVTLSSMLGLVSLPYQGVYAASKFALEAAFEALRMEVKDAGVDVSLIEPGWITTSFLQTAMASASPDWQQDEQYGKSLSKYFEISREAESDNPKGAARMAASMAGTAGQVAETVVRAVEAKSPRARYPVTAMARWLPILARLLPSRMWDNVQTGQFKS